MSEQTCLPLERQIGLPVFTDDKQRSRGIRSCYPTFSLHFINRDSLLFA
jgi:hypothetical protein